MTTTITGITVDLKAESAAFIREMGRASAATATAANSMAVSAKKIESSFLSTGKSVTQAVNGLKGLFAGQIILQGIGAITRFADSWQEATNKIKAASEISGHAADSMEAITQAAVDTRSSIEDISDTYAKLLRTTADLPAAQGNVLTMTKTVTEAFRAAGASTLEAVNATRQLGQALGSGILQGDELRSVRENAPLLAKAIANEFGTTVAGLKKLGAAGELESNRVAKAIVDSQKQIHDAFLQTNATFADTGTLLSTTFIELIGKLNQSSGASQRLYDATKVVRQGLIDLANVGVPPWIKFYVEALVILHDAVAEAAETITTQFVPVERNIVAITDAAADSWHQLFAYAGALKDVATQYEVLGQLSQQGDLASFFAEPINLANFGPGGGVPPGQLDQMMVDYKQHLKDVGKETERLAFLTDMANRRIALTVSLYEESRSPLEIYRDKIQDIKASTLDLTQQTELQHTAQLNLGAAYLEAAGMATGALASAFKENKAFQIANVVVNTAAAIVKALADPKIPWPLDLAVAASMAVAGAAQIATIASTEMGSSSKTISKPSAGGAVASAGTASTTSRSAPAQVVTINIEGDVFGPEHFRKIVAGINGVQKDGTALIRIA